MNILLSRSATRTKHYKRLLIPSRTVGSERASTNTETAGKISTPPLNKYRNTSACSPAEMYAGIYCFLRQTSERRNKLSSASSTVLVRRFINRAKRITRAGPPVARGECRCPPGVEVNIVLEVEGRSTRERTSTRGQCVPLSWAAIREGHTVGRNIRNHRRFRSPTLFLVLPGPGELELFTTTSGRRRRRDRNN